MPQKHDNFLSDAVGPRSQNLSYLDGFKFGFGFFIAGLLIALILGGLVWAGITLLGKLG